MKVICQFFRSKELQAVCKFLKPFYFWNERSNHLQIFGKIGIEISQNSLENTSTGVSFLQNCRPSARDFIRKEPLAEVFPSEFWDKFRPTNLLINILRYRFLPASFQKFLETPFSQNNSEQLPLKLLFSRKF